MDNAARLTVVDAPSVNRVKCAWNRADLGRWEEL
jgi:hypothetical protein